MREITLDSVVNTMREIVEDRESHVYQPVNGDCMYADDEGNPSCIVGWWMRAEDINLPPFVGFTNVAAISSLIVVEYLKKEGITLDDKALAFLAFAQHSQDRGCNWGRAFSEAVRYTQDMLP